jgi:hypothetical protein
MTLGNLKLLETPDRIFLPTTSEFGSRRFLGEATIAGRLTLAKAQKREGVHVTQESHHSLH